MAQIFPKWANQLPIVFVVVVVFIGIGSVGFFWYFGSPDYTDVGYRPTQPIDYSHKVHAGDLGIDCRYCHTTVEISASANVPPTQTCMNGHTVVKTESEKSVPLLASWQTGKPIEWIRVHMLPDYAYFDHSAHISVGVGCVSCHGNVAEMEKVMQVESLSMSWCLDCHKNPAEHLRPISEITNMKWEAPQNQLEFAAKVIKEKNISPPLDCSGCHR